MERIELPSGEVVLPTKRPQRGIFQVNGADPQGWGLPLDYDGTLWVVVGWSNGWAECSTKKRKDQVLVANVIFDLRPDLTDDSTLPTFLFPFSNDWLEGSGWGCRTASSNSSTFWPLPYWRGDGPYSAEEVVWAQPYLCLDVLYEVPLDVLEETFTADGLRCECGFDELEEVENEIALKQHWIWSAQRGYFKA
ncbi:hypothetical protein MMC30_002908 [Trapelia coarctata]|nr:hypothetical protein [Trapelia coarctata]